MVYRQHFTARADKHTFLSAHFARDHTCGSRHFACLKSHLSSVMSLLNIPSNPFLPILSSLATSLTTPPASQTPLIGIRLNPCAISLEDGLSGRQAGPIPNTGYEPKFCIDVSNEHTPIVLLTRNIGFPQEYDATVATSEDSNLPQQSGHQTAASTRQQAKFSHC